MESKLLKENWLKVILNLEVDDLISLYQSDINYQNILDDKYTLKLLLDKWKIKYTQLPNNFKEFVDIYDNNYASKRCENKHTIEDCIQYAGKNNQRDWLTYYFDKIFNEISDKFSDQENLIYYKKALIGAGEYNNVDLAEWIIENYLRNVPDYVSAGLYSQTLVETLKFHNYDFHVFLINELSISENGQMINTYLKYILRTADDIYPEIADIIIRYLNKNYPNWDNNNKVKNLLVARFFINYGENVAKKFMDQYNLNFIGYYAGLGIMNPQEFYKIFNNNQTLRNLIYPISTIMIESKKLNSSMIEYLLGKYPYQVNYEDIISYIAKYLTVEELEYFWEKEQPQDINLYYF